MTLNELREQYENLSGYPADGRWKESRLLSEVEVLLEKKAEKEARLAEEEKQRQIAKEMREARIAARGTLQEFIEKRFADGLSESDQKFSFALRRAVAKIEREKTEIAKFAKDVQENPSYALSWSKGLFEVAANAKVARQMIYWFEQGGTYEGWVEEARKEALRMARSPSMSTSPTSNLMDSYTAAAWADAADDWW